MSEVKNIGLFEFIDRKTPRTIRKASEQLPDDHPLRDEARELAAKAILDAALLLLIDRERQREHGAQVASIRAKQEKADAEAELKVWARGGVDVEGLAEVFDRQNHAAGFEMVAADGRPIQWQQQTPHESAKHAKHLAKRGKASPALRPKGSNCILSVSDKLAADVAKRYELPKTVCWEADGFRHWLFAGAPTSASVIGDTVKLIVSDRTHGAQRTAPLADAKWKVKPADGIDKQTGRLPRLPSSLAALLRGLGADGGTALDSLLAA